jgi:hypothetical protein
MNYPRNKTEEREQYEGKCPEWISKNGLVIAVLCILFIIGAVLFLIIHYS